MTTPNEEKKRIEGLIVCIDKDIAEVTAVYEKERNDRPFEGISYLTYLKSRRKQLASELLAAIVVERNPLQIKSPD
tara:strand:- start:288 stop:515 length:228 start_codon:yes stop_codon:yes gene_type:complete